MSSWKQSLIAVFAFVLAVGPLSACGDKSSANKADDSKSESNDDDDDKSESKKKKKKKTEGSASKPDDSAAPSVAASAPLAAPRLVVVVDQAAIDAYLADENAKLTEPVYESLVAALGACELKDFGVDYKCPANEKLQKARTRKDFYRQSSPLNTPVGKKLIAHDKPAVRAEAARLLRSLLGAQKDSIQLVIDAAKSETHPTVLKFMIESVGTELDDSDAAVAFVLKSADHESPLVRTEALSWLLRRDGKGVAGGFDKVLEKLEKDTDVGVRRSVCSHLYGTEEERAVDVLEKMVQDKSLPQELRAGCFEGLIRTWTGAPQPKRPSQKGHELTMKILEQKPRDNDNPPWQGMYTLSFAKTEPKTNFSKDWLEAVKPFYKQERLVAALESLVLDKDASYLARTSALDVLRGLGEKKATFDALATKLAGGKGQDAQVKTRAEEIGSKL